MFKSVKLSLLLLCTLSLSSSPLRIVDYTTETLLCQASVQYQDGRKFYNFAFYPTSKQDPALKTAWSIGDAAKCSRTIISSVWPVMGGLSAAGTMSFGLMVWFWMALFDLQWLKGMGKYITFFGAGVGGLTILGIILRKTAEQKELVRSTAKWLDRSTVEEPMLIKIFNPQEAAVVRQSLDLFLRISPSTRVDGGELLAGY